MRTGRSQTRSAPFSELAKLSRLTTGEEWAEKRSELKDCSRDYVLATRTAGVPRLGGPDDVASPMNGNETFCEVYIGADRPRHDGSDLEAVVHLHSLNFKIWCTFD